MSHHPQASRLAAGLQVLGLALSAEQQQKLLAYLDLLAKWNKVDATPPRMPPLPVDVMTAKLPGPGMARNTMTAATKAP